MASGIWHPQRRIEPRKKLAAAATSAEMSSTRRATPIAYSSKSEATIVLL
jgi:hypothetical protein